MPGLATRLKVAQQVLNNGVNAGITIDQPWFMFGALGPAIGDFMPIGNISAAGGEPTSSPYLAFWQQILNLSMGTTAAPGLIPTLKQLQGLVSNLQTLINNHDFDGVMALKNNGTLTQLPTLMQQLTNAVAEFQDPAQLQQLGSLIGLGPLVDSTTFQAYPTAWTGREWLHWKTPGTFADQLLADARASGDARFVSYALGWRTAIATLVCGSGFVNSIVGSSYRTYWWRFRWICNFVDTWVWGFYGAGAKLEENGEPNQDYTSWGSLCNAKLQDLIDVTGGALDGPTVASAVVQNSNPPTNTTVQPLINTGSGGLLPPPLPADFIDFWMKAFNTAYNFTPANPSTLFTPISLQAGYLMTWLMLWFQTSGDVIGCLSSTVPQPPSSSCDGNSFSQQQTASTPGQGTPSDLEPTPEHDPNTGETVCGVILAILGVIATCFDPAGIGLVVGGIALAVNGEKQLNWDTLQCQMYWIDMFMFNALWDLHKVAVLAGVQYPFASDLAISSATTIAFGPEQLSYMSSPATCQGRELNSMLQPWNASLFSTGSPLTATWTDYPTGAPVETAATSTPPWEMSQRVQWPNFIVDDIAHNPATTSLLNAPTSYDSGLAPIPPTIGGIPSFGPAVQAAVALINAGSSALPNWNLDSDRSQGWETWEFVNYGPYSVPVQVEPES
jgi:hypothetical protein